MPPRKIKQDIKDKDIKVDSDDIETKNLKTPIILKKNINVPELIIKDKKDKELEIDLDLDVDIDAADTEANIEDKSKPIIKSILKPVSKPVKSILKPVSKPVSKPVAKTIDKQLHTKKDNVIQDDDKTNEIQESQEILIDTNRKQIKSSHNHSKPKKLTASKSTESSFDMFGDDDIDFRYIMMNYDYTKNKTTPKITKYEKALIIGKRAKQIEEGANANIKVLPGQSAIEIAEEELRQRKIPLIIKRPNGNTFEYWKPIDMEVNMD